MEYCEEGDLLTFVEEKKIRLPRDLPILFCLARDMALGLRTMHRLGFIHRDIKPNNIFLKRVKGRLVAKIGDFDHTREMAESMTKSKIGTEAFNSPEIHLRQDYDLSSDIFSLGVTLIYMFAGAYPFKFHNLSKSFKELEELTNPNITDII